MSVLHILSEHYIEYILTSFVSKWEFTNFHQGSLRFAMIRLTPITRYQASGTDKLSQITKKKGGLSYNEHVDTVTFVAGLCFF